MNDDTLLQHPQQVQLKPGNRSLLSPIYQTVKFTVDKTENLTDELYFYSRAANPTVRELEMQLARLQGCEDAIAVASGCAALSSPLFSLLKSGDHVIQFAESYPPMRYLVKELLAKFGVASTLISITDTAAVQQAVQKNTRLMVFECPTNPMTHIVDIEFLTGLARANGFLTMLDNTFAGLVNHRGYDVDLYAHSLTKFASGHGDVMGGAILGKKSLISKIRHDVTQIGPVLDPHAANLISRGMKTYNLRRERQCQSALTVAKSLEKNPAVARVWYPGLESHPGHALAEKQMGDFGGVLAFDLKEMKVGEFLNRLKLFTFAASLGSCESLAAPAQAFYARDLSAEMQKSAGISVGSVRLSIGLEDPADLIADLQQALA